jgi:hypothetical protein
MSFFKNLFKSKETKHKENVDYLLKNYNALIDYWSGVIEGTQKLEDGSTFNDNTVYNTKHLKYKKSYLEQACIYSAKTSKSKIIYNATRTCYMWFANFNDKVEDKISNTTQDILNIVAETGDGDMQKLIDKIADVPHDEKKSKEIFNAIQKTQLAYLKKFDELTAK